MFNTMMKRSLILFTAGMLVFSGSSLIGSVHGATDDMDAVSFTKMLVGKEFTVSEESPNKGFDASGMVYHVFKTLNYSIPRELVDQFKMNAMNISNISALQPGDIVFFGTKPFVSFDGIYVGNGKFVMSSRQKDEVVTRNLVDYNATFLLGKRILSKDDQLRINIVLKGRQYLGVPYVFGAAVGQTLTFDCSSFTKTVYQSLGITLPRVSRNQATAGEYISKQNLLTGDLVFFTTRDSNGKIGHVGIYVGDGMMLHTYGEGGVKYSSINSDWWADHYVTGRRVI